MINKMQFLFRIHSVEVRLGIGLTDVESKLLHEAATCVNEDKYSIVNKYHINVNNFITTSRRRLISFILIAEKYIGIGYVMDKYTDFDNISLYSMVHGNTNYSMNSWEKIRYISELKSFIDIYYSEEYSVDILMGKLSEYNSKYRIELIPKLKEPHEAI